MDTTAGVPNSARDPKIFKEEVSKSPQHPVIQRPLAPVFGPFSYGLDINLAEIRNPPQTPAPVEHPQSDEREEVVISLGQALRELRNRRSLSKTDLSRLTELLKTYNQLPRGKTKHLVGPVIDVLLLAKRNTCLKSACDEVKEVILSSEMPEDLSKVIKKILQRAKDAGKDGVEILGAFVEFLQYAELPPRDKLAYALLLMQMKSKAKVFAEKIAVLVHNALKSPLLVDAGLKEEEVITVTAIAKHLADYSKPHLWIMGESLFNELLAHIPKTGISLNPIFELFLNTSLNEATSANTLDEKKEAFKCFVKLLNKLTSCHDLISLELTPDPVNVLIRLIKAFPNRELSQIHNAVLNPFCVAMGWPSAPKEENETLRMHSHFEKCCLSLLEKSLAEDPKSDKGTFFTRIASESCVALEMLPEHRQKAEKERLRNLVWQTILRLINFPLNPIDQLNRQRIRELAIAFKDCLDPDLQRLVVTLFPKEKTSAPFDCAFIRPFVEPYSFEKFDFLLDLIPTLLSMQHYDALIEMYRGLLKHCRKLAFEMEEFKIVAAVQQLFKSGVERSLNLRENKAFKAYAQTIQNMLLDFSLEGVKASPLSPIECYAATLNLLTVARFQEFPPDKARWETLCCLLVDALKDRCDNSAGLKAVAYLVDAIELWSQEHPETYFNKKLKELSQHFTLFDDLYPEIAVLIIEDYLCPDALNVTLNVIWKESENLFSQIDDVTTLLNQLAWMQEMLTYRLVSNQQQVYRMALKWIERAKHVLSALARIEGIELTALIQALTKAMKDLLSTCLHEYVSKELMASYWLAVLKQICSKNLRHFIQEWEQFMEDEKLPDLSQFFLPKHR